MMRRAFLATLVLLSALPASAQRRRAAAPGCGSGLIAAEAWARSIAVDEAAIYYLDETDQTIYRAPKDRGPRVALAAFPPYAIYDIAVDATTVYVATDAGAIVAVPRDGGTAGSVVSGIAHPYQLALDETHLYWVAAGTLDVTKGTIKVLSDGKIERSRKDGSQRQTLATGLSAPTNLLVDANAVYFNELGIAVGNARAGIRRVAKTGGAAVPLTDAAASELAQSATEILFFHADGISRIGKGGGEAVTLVADEFIFAGPRVFRDDVYYITTTDAFLAALMKVPASGGAPELVRITNALESDFEVDDCGLFYGE